MSRDESCERSNVSDRPRPGTGLLEIVALKQPFEVCGKLGPSRLAMSPSNNRFERSRGVASSVSQGGGSMIGIKHLRLAPRRRVAQPHR
jgi:hypothetical protein